MAPLLQMPLRTHGGVKDIAFPQREYEREERDS
jgi:hypothetical protein